LSGIVAFAVESFSLIGDNVYGFIGELGFVRQLGLEMVTGQAPVDGVHVCFMMSDGRFATLWMAIVNMMANSNFFEWGYVLGTRASKESMVRLASRARARIGDDLSILNSENTFLNSLPTSLMGAVFVPNKELDICRVNDSGISLFGASDELLRGQYLEYIVSK